MPTATRPISGNEASAVHDAAELVAPQAVEAEPVVARRVLRPEQAVVQALREQILAAR